MIPLKIKDRQRENQEFLMLLKQRNKLLQTDLKIMYEFRQEMARFIFDDSNKAAVVKDKFWQFLVNLISSYYEKIENVIRL